MGPASGWGLVLSVVGGFVLSWPNAADGGVQPPGAEPVHVPGSGQLDVRQGFPWAAFLDQLGLLQADSIRALSSASPTVPIEASIRRAVNAKLGYPSTPTASGRASTGDATIPAMGDGLLR